MEGSQKTLGQNGLRKAWALLLGKPWERASTGLQWVRARDLRDLVQQSHLKTKIYGKGVICQRSLSTQMDL